MKIVAIILLILCIASLGFGVYKLTVYEYNNYHYVELGANAYVADDGDNRIINANYAIAYFVLAGVLGMFSISLFVVSRFTKKTSKYQSDVFQG